MGVIAFQNITIRDCNWTVGDKKKTALGGGLLLQCTTCKICNVNEFYVGVHKICIDLAEKVHRSIGTFVKSTIFFIPKSLYILLLFSFLWKNNRVPSLHTYIILLNFLFPIGGRKKRRNGEIYIKFGVLQTNIHFDLSLSLSFLNQAFQLHKLSLSTIFFFSKIKKKNITSFRVLLFFFFGFLANMQLVNMQAEPLCFKYFLNFATYNTY